MRHIIIAEGLKPGKRAMLAAWTTSDTYAQGDIWQQADELLPGQPVTAINHFGRHVTKTGETVKVENDAGKGFGKVTIDRIELVNTVDLTDRQLADLGYASYAELFDAQPGYRNRRAWLVYYTPQPSFLDRLRGKS